MFTRRSLLLGPDPARGDVRARGQGNDAARPNGRRGPRAGYFPNVVLQTHEERSVRFYDDLIEGRIVAINMMYAECTGICPMMTGNLVKVQKALGGRVGRDIFMYSITLQPAIDTPSVLKTYVEQHGVGPGWQFLTGRPGDIEVLRRKLGFFDPDPVRDRVKTNHAGIVRVGNEARDTWCATSALGRPEDIVQSILWMDVESKKDADQ